MDIISVGAGTDTVNAGADAYNYAHTTAAANATNFTSFVMADDIFYFIACSYEALADTAAFKQQLRLLVQLFNS